MGVLRVALVAAAHLVGEHLDLHPVPLRVPARRAHLGVGIEPDLQLGVRRHDLADVAALDHGVALLGELALALAHDLAHLRVPRDDRDGGVDLGRADLGRHVVAPDEDAASLAELDRMLAREVDERGNVVELDPVVQRQPGEGAVHRAGVEIAEPEPRRERARDRALTGPGGPVDRDDHFCLGQK